MIDGTGEEQKNEERLLGSKGKIKEKIEALNVMQIANGGEKQQPV